MSEIILNPTATRLIVRPAKVFVTRTASNIEITQVEEERPQTGVVLAAGPDCKRVMAGQVVMFGKFTGTEAQVTPTDLLLILEEHDILCTITNDAGDPPAVG